MFLTWSSLFLSHREGKVKSLEGKGVLRKEVYQAMRGKDYPGKDYSISKLKKKEFMMGN